MFILVTVWKTNTVC